MSIRCVNIQSYIYACHILIYIYIYIFIYIYIHMSCPLRPIHIIHAWLMAMGVYADTPCTASQPPQNKPDKT